MEFHQLKSFYYVASYSNFSKAAKKLMLTQPAVSQHIEALEKHFGIPLFYRGNRKVELTDAGRNFLQHAERMLLIRETVKKSMEAYKRLEYGELIVGTDSTIGNYIISPLIALFKKVQSGINIQLHTQQSNDLVHGSKLGLLDMAIVPELLEGLDKDAQPFIKDDIILVASRGHILSGRREVTGDELANETLFLHAKGSYIRTCSDEIFNRHGFSPTKVIEYDTIEAIKQAVIQGHGIGLLPKCAISSEMKSKALYTIGHDWKKRIEFFTLFPRSICPSPTAVEFTAFLKEKIKMH
jgi:DNA-binding transcriptional LysR family regulator